MLESKKAQTGEIIPFIGYMLLTVAIIFAFRWLPTALETETLQTHNLENKIYNELVFNTASYQDELTKRIQTGTIDWNAFNDKTLENSIDTEKFLRQIAFKISLPGKTSYLNKALYEKGKPLAPVRYDEFIEKRQIKTKEGQEFTLEIDQVFSSRLKSE